MLRLKSSIDVIIGGVQIYFVERNFANTYNDKRAKKQHRLALVPLLFNK